MAKQYITYTVYLCDAWSSFAFVDQKWEGYISRTYRAKLETANRLADKLMHKGIKTGKGYTDKWLIEVIEHNHTDKTKQIIRTIQF